MFIGHFAVALGAKRAVPTASLGTLVFSAQFLDLLWPILVLLGIEHVRIDPGNTAVTPLDFYDYPISHSLVTSVVWALLVGAIYFGLRRDRNTAIILSGVVFSHWLLDFLTHRPDLPIVPGGSTLVGLGLWNSVAGTVIVEFLMFIVGVALYIKTTVSRGKTGSFGLWLFVAFLISIYLGNVFGPPPPSESLIAVSGLGIWLLVLWANWIDRNRMVHQSFRENS